MAHEHNSQTNSKSFIIKILISAVTFALALIFKKYEYISLALFLTSYIIIGLDVLIEAFKNLFKCHILDENFLMCIASIGAIAINQYPEGIAVMAFYQIGEYFQNKAVDHSKKSISDLMDIRPDYANLFKDNKAIKVSPQEVNINDIIIIKPGEKIPLDGAVIDGSSMVDTSVLTGESVPKSVSVGKDVFSGCINKSGVLKVEVKKEFSQTTVSKIIDLVENASSKKSDTENFITRFAKYYTPIVVFIALLLALIPPLLLQQDWNTWIYRALVFLVVSCPCALVISIPLGFLAGIGSSSKNGILVKGSNYIDALSKLNTIVFDKTGTLTKGVFKVQNIYPEKGFKTEEILKFAACAEKFSSHPIATSIKNEYGKSIENEDIKNYEDISGYGISVEVNGSKILVGNEKIMQKYNVIFSSNKEIGTKAYISINNKFAGIIVISDEIKQDSINAIESLKNQNINNIIMLTGDSNEIAINIANIVGINKVYSSLLPDEKVKRIEEILNNQPKDKKLAFVGDGINDAPVLARADIGIAMGSLGSDAAIEAADVVLMTDEPTKISTAIKISKYTKKIVKQNIVFSLVSKLVILILGAIGIATMWEAVFVDVGVSLLAILNSIRILNHKF